MKKLLIILLVPLLFIGCRKDRLTKEKEVLIGTWEWQYTEYVDGLCGTGMDTSYVFTSTTINTNYTMKFIKKGIVEIYKNGNLLEEGKVKFDYWGKPSVDGYGFELFVNGENEKSIYGRVNNESLVLTRSYFFQNDNDCFNFSNNTWCCANICYYIKQ